MLPELAGQRREPWPSPLRAGLPALIASLGDGPVVALASGDPLVSGIGTTLIDLLGRDAVPVVPAVSSVALARAELGWPAESCAVVSVTGRDPSLVLRELAPGGRLVVHGVTLETERLLADAYLRHGGELTRIAVETAAPLGSYTGWTPARTVVQWAVTR